MDRNEVRRLQKAARDNNKLALGEWATKFENGIRREFEREYEKAFQAELAASIDNFLTATAYTALFSEETHLDKDTLPSFMEDLFVTIDMFRTGEYYPEEYKNALKENGVEVEDYSYRSTMSKIITIIGKEDATFIQPMLCKKGYIVLYRKLKEDDKIHREKIMLADELYVAVKKYEDLTEKDKEDIKFARDKGKKIIYMYEEEDNECSDSHKV